MMNINGKVCKSLVNFPIALILENKEEKQAIIKEYRYLCDEQIGKLLEYIDAIESGRWYIEGYEVPLEIDRLNKMIEWIEWQFDLWSKHLKIKNIE
jgi:hypothetical protein